MNKIDNQFVFSATDIVNFIECEHLTFLDLLHLENPMEKTEDSATAQAAQKKGLQHEREYAEQLKQQHKSFIDINDKASALDTKVAETLTAMQKGVEIIYQAAFKVDSFIGYADFLRKVEDPSNFGNYSYEVLDTKLSKTEKAKFVLQLACYAWMLERVQGVAPKKIYIVLGDKQSISYHVSDFYHYFLEAKDRLLAFVETKKDTYPNPCSKCDLCHWKAKCEDQWIQDDHLSQVANIKKVQIKHLNENKINTMKDLALMPDSQNINKISEYVLIRLKHQAKLQYEYKLTNKLKYELIPDAEEPKLHGFEKLPKPNHGDLYFDMEGYPFYFEETANAKNPKGLEYLFGLYFIHNNTETFKGFWGHNRKEEKKAFEDFIDFVTEHLRHYPDAHIYHYASYEETALKKLMGLHATRETEVDNLLRQNKLIDLYEVVRESIRVSETKYSIKNIEHFYLEARTADVKNAGDSIIQYETWQETSDPKILKEIEEYNKDDVRSTLYLHRWLLKIRPDSIPWFAPNGEIQGDIKQLNETDIKLDKYKQSLLNSLPEDKSLWTPHDRLSELIYYLLDFNRRENKPEWWAYFKRQNLQSQPDELLDDLECIALCSTDLQTPRFQEKQSYRYTYNFIPQEFKLKSGDRCVDLETLSSLNELEIDPKNYKLSFKMGIAKPELAKNISIGKGAPIESGSLSDAVYRYADNFINNIKNQTDSYKAITAFLKRDFPKIKDIASGESILIKTDDVDENLVNIIESIKNLDDSYMFIQGPPGTGKTYTGANIILALIQLGKKVGVTSNSHSAINNLLKRTEELAKARNISFAGVKRSSKDEDSTQFKGDFIVDVFKNQDVGKNDYSLIAGTPWLFSDIEMDSKLDYLFIDEAGQVAIARVVGVGTSARNIILLGDQMQLSQPTKGVHPGESGLSSLDYLLQDEQTIPDNKGIFLKTTWRLHPEICHFISDVVYEGKLLPHTDNLKRKLLLNEGHDSALKEFGIKFLPIDHDGCSQSCEEEAKRIADIYNNLMKQKYINEDGKINQITSEDILIVAPYNQQVNLLKSKLPSNARVGTVDKFQGQEAEVVIISMTSSSGEYLPRNIEFSFSQNRINVAISRAKCLAIMVANPELLKVNCNTPDEISLVNTLCKLSRDYR
jgi:predicted RecB family nuclease